MVARLTILFIILSNYSFAQPGNIRVPTKFDRFVESPKIQWAAYINDTIGFNSYNVTDQLLKRFLKGEIKITEPISRELLMEGNKPSYITKDALARKSYAPGMFPEDPASQKPTNRVDSNSYIMNVQQVLYVSNGKLLTYVPWVSPKISVYTSSGRFIGTAEYFSCCENNKYNFKPSRKDEIIYITTSTLNILPDSFPKTEMLKQWYGNNIMELIWQDLFKKENEVINLANGHTLSLDELQRFSFSHSKPIPVYNSSGNMIGAKNYTEPVSPLHFQQMVITQDWYYNKTKNIIINNIINITLAVKQKEIAEGYTPVLKIIFK